MHAEQPLIACRANIGRWHDSHVHSSGSHMTSITLSIADDHPIILHSVKLLVEHQPLLQLRHVCNSGRELLAALARDPTHLVLTDLTMPAPGGSYDGLALLRAVRAVAPHSGLIVLTAQSNAAILTKAMQLGARALVGKNDPAHEIIRACMQVHAGATHHVSPAMRKRMEDGRSTHMCDSNLTQKELDVVRLTANGLSLSEIALQYRRSVSTISSQKSTAMRKLGVHSTADLIRYATENGLT
ncbi:response regulator transcription factor [Burkholderia ubonensis]|uniref:response regulator transcription factor n=1 Tax=Burkholderia ubonensis TaxID=101571 RepID=UPI0012FB06DE|nr:response regulator transcription factor [Burkholderia ubonensis]